MSEMTATRIGRSATIAVAAVVVWLLAAFFLWRTKVPTDLPRPHLDAHAVFGVRATRAGARFDRFFDLEWLLTTLTSFVVLAVFLVRGPRLARRLGLRPVNAGIITAVFITFVLWAASVPFELAGSWWSRRHGIAQRSWSSILFDPVGGLVQTTVSTTVVIAVVLLLAKRLPRTWWLAAAGVVLLLGVGLQFVLPYVQRLGPHPVRSPGLAAPIQTLGRQGGGGGAAGGGPPGAHPT